MTQRAGSSAQVARAAAGALARMRGVARPQGAHFAHEAEAEELAGRVLADEPAADEEARGLVEGGPELDARAELARA